MFISDYPLYSKSFHFEVVSDFEFMATIGWEGLMLKEARRERIEKIEKNELFEWEEGRTMNTCMPLENHSKDVDATNQKTTISAISAKLNCKFLIFYQKVGKPWSKMLL